MIACGADMQLCAVDGRCLAYLFGSHAVYYIVSFLRVQHNLKIIFVLANPCVYSTCKIVANILLDKSKGVL